MRLHFLLNRLYQVFDSSPMNLLNGNSGVKAATTPTTFERFSNATFVNLINFDWDVIRAGVKEKNNFRWKDISKKISPSVFVGE